MQCPRCQHKNPSRQKFCAQCGTSLADAHQGDPPGSSYANLQRAVEHLTLALNESLEQQKATSQILRVISSSPTNVQPVLDAVAESAARLCEAPDVSIFVREADHLRVAARHGPIPSDTALPLNRESGVGWAVLAGRTVHVADMQTELDRFPISVQNARRLGFRTALNVPLIREGVAIGVISLRRAEAHLFAERQVALLETFADQAVIAIENVRLFTELQAKNRALTQAHGQVTEALNHQTATAEILRVISSSQTDVQPVFDTIVQNAARLCHAANAAVFLTDGRLVHQPANYGSSPPEALAAALARFPRPLDMDTLPGIVILTRSVVHVSDTEEPSAVLLVREAGRLLGFRSTVAVPMLREREAIGSINVARREPGRFSDAEVELLRTFADQAVIAIQNVRMFSELQASNRELTTALDQRTAAADVLRVIGSSPTDAQPVFEAIVSSARRLLGGFGGAVYRVSGDEIHLAAYISTNPSGDAALRSSFPRPLAVFSPPGEAMRRRAPVVLTDIMTAGWIPDDIRDLIRKRGDRSGVWVPMMREGMALGAIGVTRSEPGSFAEEQIALLKTFADQAVIAIENVRLFTELQEKNKALTETHAQVSEALEQQTATGDILRVISSSPTDVQPVFDAVAESAARLCEAFDSTIFRIDGNRLCLVAHHGPIPFGPIGEFTIPVVRGSVGGRSVLEGRTIHVADLQTEANEFPEGSELARRFSYRTTASVPLMREGVAIGLINLRRTDARVFSERQITLLKTFADQAVIAIENVRLFTELQEKNHALTAAHAQVTEALEQQTATAEILRVISSSQTDVQPVFDTIVRSAVRLCGGLFSALFQFDGELIHHVANHNHTAEAIDEVHRIYPARPTRDLFTGRAILERAVVHIPNVELDPEFQHRAISRAIGFRSGLWVPMLREGNPIGVIVVNRAEAGPFSDSEIELLKTFADQAVIAVENARLFKELQARTGELTQSVEKLTALGEVSRAVTSTLDVETVLDTIVSRASQLAGADGCSIFEYDEAAEQFELRAIHNDDPAFVEALRAVPVRKGEGLMGRAAEIREPIQVPDITQPGAYQSSARDTLIRFGYRAVLSVPLLREDQIIGSLSFNRKAPGEFSPEVVEVLNTFATQSVLAIQNARLFHEIADKSRQLEAASQHKSEFLANMSHELRTPLNAIIGLSEVLAQGMFGAINDKQTEYLHDILESGRHLLSLINDILDLSKIEAGRMELELIDFDLPQAIQNALTLVRERALRRGIALHHAIDDRVAAIRSDERKVKQVLLNLLSNAIKFTPEGGRIEVRAASTDGMVEVSVTDTGFGIAPEDQDAVFEEFRQVGTADKKAEGTGLGLALSRKFIELHGGRIWVTSQVGVGSTFTFTLPVRPWPAS
jgi:GAF domain-containing protein